MKVLILHGPHLSLLGKVSSYNKTQLTLDKVNKYLRKTARNNEIDLKIFQHFSQKNFLKSILTNRNDIDGIILNLGGMSRNFYALQEMLAIIRKPVVEVMLAEFPFSEQNFKESSIGEIAQKRIYKKSLPAYEEALNFFINLKNSDL